MARSLAVLALTALCWAASIASVVAAGGEHTEQVFAVLFWLRASRRKAYSCSAAESAML